MAIIVVLISLLLPAVQAAREAGRRAQCMSNLKQMALAVQNYEQANHKLPAAGAFLPKEQAIFFDNQWSYRRINMRQGLLHGWMIQLLPFVEQQALYNQFDFKTHVANNYRNPQVAQPPVYLCASDNAVGRMYRYLAAPNPGTPFQFGKGNYAGFAGPFHIDGPDFPGAISLFGQKLSDVVDGTADTLLMAEIRTREEVTDQRGAWALPWSGASLLSVDMHYPAFGRDDDKDAVGGYRYSNVSFGYTQRPNSNTPDVLYQCPESVRVDALLEAMPCNDEYWGYISAAPRSNHPGGVHVAYLDGHVTFMANSVDEITLAYQASINDEQLHDAMQ
jgi:prepilin-type processing-associated H-X9-DG protein